jgi:hypothetical protein
LKEEKNTGLWRLKSLLERKEEYWSMASNVSFERGEEHWAMASKVSS